MRPLILTGGPAVGKTTCGRALARERTRGAYIDADDVRQYVVAGDAAMWAGDEGRAQHALAARNIGAMGRNLLAAGFDLVAADVLTEVALELYRESLPDCLVVHLAITLEAARERATTRPVFITGDEFDLLHRMTAAPLRVDAVLDVTGMSLPQQITTIRQVWDRGTG